VGVGETGGSRILHDWELQNVFLVDILNMAKSSRVVCGVHNMHRAEEKFMESFCWKI
jgi:hypothetical protein